MTTPKPDIPATATPTSASNLSQEDQDFYKEPEFNTVAQMDPKDGVVPSPTAETAKLGIKPEPKVDVAAAPVAATINGKAQETPITPKAQAVIITAPAPAPVPAVPTSPTTITPATTTVATTTVDPTAVPAVTAAIAAALHSTDDVDMTLAPGTPIEELSLVVEESIDDDSDPDEGKDSCHLKPAILFTISHRTTENIEHRKRKRERERHGRKSNGTHCHQNLETGEQSTVQDIR